MNPAPYHRFHLTTLAPKEPNPMSANTTTIDVRSIVPRERHPLIFSTLGGLEWACHQSWPDTRHVQITRREAGACCGGR